MTSHMLDHEMVKLAMSCLHDIPHHFLDRICCQYASCCACATTRVVAQNSVLGVGRSSRRWPQLLFHAISGIRRIATGYCVTPRKG